MTAPALFLGQRNSSALLEANVGTTDNATAYGIRMRTCRLAPAGLVLTATFVAAHVTVVYTNAQTVTVRLLVDDTTTITRTFALPAQASEVQYKFAVWFSVPLIISGVERARLHPRGVWAQLEFETDGSAPLAIDGVELEWDPAGRR